MPKLTIDIEARLAQFQDSLDRVGRDTSRAVGQLDKAFSALGTTLAALGAGAALTSLSGFVRNAIDAADGFGKLSQRVGVTVERLSELAVAARVSDVSQEQLQQGLVRLSVNAEQAARGVGEAAGGFNALGVSLRDSQGNLRSTDALFTDIAGKLAKIEDGAGKTALTVALFGRSGAELLPLINSLSETEQLAARLGATIDTKTAKAAERFNDNMELVRVSVEATGTRIAAQLLPTLERLSERLIAFAQDAGRVSEGAAIIDAGLKLAASAAIVVAESFAVAGRQLGALVAALDQLRQGEFRLAFQTLREGAEEAFGRVFELPGRVAEVWDSAAADVASQAPALSDKLAAPAILTAKKTTAAVDEVARAAGRLAAFNLQVQTEANEAVNTYQKSIAKQLEERAAATERQWAQVFQTIDQEQEDAIANGEALLDRLAQASRRAADAARELGFTFESAFESAVIEGENLRDVLRGLLQDIARIVLRQTVTTPLANAVSGVLGGFFSGGGPTPLQLSGPFATGGSFTVGGSGGTDSQMVAFRATPGEKVTVTPPDKLPGGGVTVIQNNTINAGGGGADIERRILAAMRQAKNEAVAAVIEANRRAAWTPIT